MNRPGLFDARFISQRTGLGTVETYWAGGCPTCHEAELPGAIAWVRAQIATGS